MGKIFPNFFEILFNLFLFFPYFFSVKRLLKTLFDPWKNIQDESLSFNLISRGIGFVMRTSILVAFLFFMVFYIISIPFIIVLFLLTLPLRLLILPFRTSEERRKLLEKKAFTQTHMLNPVNQKNVEDWFDHVYAGKQTRKKWWDLSHLYQTPPLAHDWSSGYTPNLTQFTDDLTSSDENLSSIIVGRKKEIKEIETTLSQSHEANALLIGNEGVGKSSIIDGLAQRIYTGQSGNLLNYKRVLRLNVEKIAAKHSDVKQREEFIESLFKEASDAGNIIFVIDYLNRYIQSTADSINVSSSIAKFAKSPRIQFLATVLPKQYQDAVVPNESVHNLFTPLRIEPLSKEETLRIILESYHVFEHRYALSIPYETILDTIIKSETFILDIPFPNKAIKLLDIACSIASKQNQKQLTPSHIDKAVEQYAHVPVKPDESTKSILVHFEDELLKSIIGQQKAVRKIASTIRTAYVELEYRKKPIASLLFLGPTGTGKTETAKAIAKTLFKTDSAFIRLDMSNYQNKEQEQDLLRELATQIHTNPSGVLLLDEIEKIHRDLLNIFLTITDEGYFTDQSGKQVNCKNLIIIATSNAAADFIFKTLHVQNTTPLINEEVIEQYLVNKGYFSPEFLNRFDGVIVYEPLSKKVLFEIAKRTAIELVKKYQSSHEVTVTITDELIERFTNENYRPEYGARNIQRVIQQHIEDKLATLLLENKIKTGDTVSLH